MSLPKSWPWILAALLICLFLYAVMPILSPFLIAFLLAYLGDPVVDFLTKKGLSRTLSVVVVFAVLSLVGIITLLILLPLLSSQIAKLIGLIPNFLDWLQHTVMPWAQQKAGVSGDVFKADKIKASLAGNLDQTTDIISIVVKKITRSGLAFFAWIANMVLIPVVAFYLMRDWDLVLQRIRDILPRGQEAKILSLTHECHEVLGAFIRGQLMVMIALGTIYALGLSLIGLDLGLIIGLLAGLASIVPYMGFVVGISAALAAVFFQFGLDPYVLIGVAVVFAIGQALEGMVLTPLLVGDKIGLHPVAVIFAILAGGELFGFTGILLALPVASIIVVLLRHIYRIYQASDVYQADASESVEATPEVIGLAPEKKPEKPN